MSMITRRAGLAIAAALLVGVGGRASASAGNGIRLGGSEGRLHPYLEVEDRYDSNVYFTAPADGSKQVGDMILHIRPGFDLAVPGEVTAAELGGSLDWAQYLGLGNTETRSQLSKLYGQANLGVSVNRRGMVGLEVDDEFRRAQGTTAFVLSNAVISNYNALRLKVPYRPGGGALTIGLNGAWMLETFEAFYTDPPCVGCAPTDYGKLGYNEFRAGAEGRWRFLPRTALVVQAGWFSRVPSDSQASKVSGYEAAAGFTGLVTAHLGATLKGGYTSTTGVAEGNVGTFLAQIEGEWIATDSASMKLGWAHGLGIDPGPSLYTSNRVYAGGRILLAGRYAARTDLTWETRDYDVFALGGATGTASATVLRIEPALEAGVTRWLSGSIGYAFSKRTSSLPATTLAIPPGFDYTKNEMWIRAAVRY